jgi:hypothetical protein
MSYVCDYETDALPTELKPQLVSPMLNFTFINPIRVRVPGLLLPVREGRLEEETLFTQPESTPATVALVSIYRSSRCWREGGRD